MFVMLCAIELNSEPIKYAVIVLSIPIWMPFAKAAWEELNESLAEEGGLFGEEPDAEELARMRLESTRDTPMVSDPWDKPSFGVRGATNAARDIEHDLNQIRRRGFRDTKR
jgi:hypothetical protein